MAYYMMFTNFCLWLELGIANKEILNYNFYEDKKKDCCPYLGIFFLCDRKTPKVITR